MKDQKTRTVEGLTIAIKEEITSRADNYADSEMESVKFNQVFS